MSGDCLGDGTVVDLDVTLYRSTAREPALADQKTLYVALPSRKQRLHGFAVAYWPYAAVMAVFASLLWVSSRASRPKEFSFPVEATVRSDRNEPISGVKVLVGEKLLGTTGATGMACGVVRVPDGQQMRIRFTVPDGFRSMGPTEMLVRTQLTRPLQGGRARPETLRATLTVAPVLRTYSVAVRTNGIPGLKVLVFGRPAAVTDDKGLAQVTFSDSPPPKGSGELQVTIDTSAFPGLHPANPSQTFVLADEDQAFEVKQEFRQIRRDGGKRSAARLREL